MVRNSLSACLLLFAVLPSCIFAHTYLSSLVIDGSALAPGQCVRAHPATAYDSPIPLVTDADMTCGWLPYAAQATSQKCPIAAGSTIGLQWYHTSPGPQDDIIATTHVGPLMVYLAKSETGSGAVWFKIYEDGYDASTKQWAVTKLINNRGLVTVKIPSDIAPGNYLLRGEILALHGANALNGVQPYVGCAELTISGSGSAKPAGVAIPGVYSQTDPGMFFDIYQSFTSYPIPGPAVYTGSSESSQSTSAAPISSATSKPSTSAPQTTTTTAPQTTTTTPTTPRATTTPKPATTTTTTPKATQKPTSSSTSAPTASSGSGSASSSATRIQLYPSSSQWWIAVTTRDTPTLASIKFKDAGSYTQYTDMQITNWGYYTYGAVDGKSFVLPISVQLVLADGSSAQLQNVFTSWSETTFKNVNANFVKMQYSARTTIPQEPEEVVGEPEKVGSDGDATDAADVTDSSSDFPSEDDADNNNNNGGDAPSPAAPMQNVTAAPIVVGGEQAPTVPPSTSIKAQVHEGSSLWWFAVLISNSNLAVSYIELRDASPHSGWTGLTQSDWDFWTYQTNGQALVAPLVFRLTAKNGRSVTFLMDEVTPSALIDTKVQFL